MQGDVREKLQEMEAGSVQTVVTSPPYWGLRDYGLKPSVWGGDPKCGHEWGNEMITKMRTKPGVNAQCGNTKAEVAAREEQVKMVLSVIERSGE